MNYFIHDERDLSPAYVRKCEKFIHSLRNAGLVRKKDAAALFKLQAASAMKQTQLNVLTTAEYKKLERKFKK